MPSIQQASHLRHRISQLPRINQSLKNMGKNRLEMKENVKQHQYRNFSFISFLFMAHFSYLTSLFSISLIYFRVFLLFCFFFFGKNVTRNWILFPFFFIMFEMVTKNPFFLWIFVIFLFLFTLSICGKNVYFQIFLPSFLFYICMCVCVCFCEYTLI